ncbi:MULTISPECIES: sulfur carrier protein ThiS [Cedecea]|jgi:sulfur carrier protein|uniref:Thiamine biosynthesis protein ThiS n=1 Tax=Cedecea neteri TaxID=158822 RepID=A0A089Q3W9_9ENTR|nr:MULTISPECIES: sulfur carrier protein ThiS [Cedecea]AIR05174.1 thiamine biosynthesis protein ThiS [Cedecea neteri]NWC65123.1 sulfur carrier protein ThiS [Cedecea sp. P7760]
MRIQFNDEPLECTEGMTLATLLAQLEQGKAGAALAVNQTIIPREQWSNYLLREGDTILLFQAIAGG